MSVVTLERPKPRRARKLAAQKAPGVRVTRRGHHSHASVALALLGLSLSHLASGVAIVTGSGERDGWLMAVGIDMGFVALELALLVAPAATRPAVGRYASPAIVGTLATSAAMNAFAFASHADGLMIYPAIGLGFAVPALVYALTQDGRDHVFRTGLAMRLFQTMIFADRPRNGVRLALTTFASGAILEIYPRGISPETMVPLVLVHVSQSDVDRARRACEAFEREMTG